MKRVLSVMILSAILTFTVQEKVFAYDVYCGVGGITGWTCYAMTETFHRYDGDMARGGEEYCSYTATLKMVTQSGNVHYLDYIIHVGNFPAWFENSQGYKGRITAETNVEQNLLNCLSNYYRR